MITAYSVTLALFIVMFALGVGHFRSAPPAVDWADVYENRHNLNLDFTRSITVTGFYYTAPQGEGGELLCGTASLLVNERKPNPEVPVLFRSGDVMSFRIENRPCPPKRPHQ